jgi:hypothetical protein
VCTCTAHRQFDSGPAHAHGSVAHSGLLLYAPLLDPEIRLETHLASVVNNTSPLLSEFVRSFMKRIELERAVTQMQLPMGEGNITKLTEED